MVTVALAGLLVLLIGIGLYQTMGRTSPGGTANPTGAASPPDNQAGSDSGVRAELGRTVRPDSHRLSTAADGKVTFVEFLDFECEGCSAVYPAVEQLRQTYAGRVTFVARYFPLEAHFNAQRAARAVEAAARQGQFEAMYRRMFDTQSEWGEQQVPKDELFRSYAAELGLDLARFDADYASDAVWDRIQTDIDDGNALGVSGTPSFFLNGQPLKPESLDDLTRALDQALAQ